MKQTHYPPIRAVYFDMDGTLASTYDSPNWEQLLKDCDPSPYETARPLLNMSALARHLHRLQKKGYTIGIVSWLGKVGTTDYHNQVTEIKLHWLAKHLPSVQWDEIHIIPYGTPKSSCANNGILFDDNSAVRLEWSGVERIAYPEIEILEVLKTL